MFSIRKKSPKKIRLLEIWLQGFQLKVLSWYPFIVQSSTARKGEKHPDTFMLTGEISLAGYGALQIFFKILVVMED